MTEKRTNPSPQKVCLLRKDGKPLSPGFHRVRLCEIVQQNDPSLPVTILVEDLPLQVGDG